MIYVKTRTLCSYFLTALTCVTLKKKKKSKQEFKNFLVNLVL